MNQFTSKEYGKYEAWQKVVFWIGILSFLNLTYWIVRLILFLVIKEKPLKERVNYYTTQTYVFGWINIFVLLILLVVFLFVFTLLGAMMLSTLSRPV